MKPSKNINNSFAEASADSHLSCDIEKGHHSDSQEVNTPMNIGKHINTKSTGRLFQYPMKSILDSVTAQSQSSPDRRGRVRDYLEDSFDNGEASLGECPRGKNQSNTIPIVIRGATPNQLILIQYCFMSQNMPLLSTLPFKLMLSQNKKQEERKYAEDLETEGSNQAFRTPFQSQKKRKIRKVSKKGINPMKMVHDKIYNKKKARKLYSVLKRLFKNKTKDNFDILCQAEKSIVLQRPSFKSMSSISMSVLSGSCFFPSDINNSFCSVRFESPLAKKKKKVDPEVYKKRVNKGLDIIGNILSRVVISRRKIIWDVLEEIRYSDSDIFASKRTKDTHAFTSSQRDNSKTEPSTEIEPPVFGKTDLDYYFLERLEKMRDCGIKEDDYNLIAQEEKFSLERAERSDDEDMGYISDNENHSSDCYLSDGSIKHTQREQRSSLKYLGMMDKPSENDEGQMYFYANEELQNAIRLNPQSVMSIDEMGNSSVLTIELRSLLKDCTEYSRVSELSSELGLSKCLSESVENSKKSEMHFRGKYMKEDIEMMSKEIEKIRDQILNNPQMLTPTKPDDFKTPEKLLRKRSYHKRNRDKGGLEY